MDYGTKERQRHGSLKLEPRDLSHGGNVISTGLRETHTSTLDALRNGGYLGSAEETDRRYVAGYRLWQLFTQFGDTQRAKDIGAPGRGSPGAGTVLEGEIGDRVDFAETLYNKIMTSLAFRARIVRVICIDGTLNWPCPVNTDPRYLEMVQDGLDDLWVILSGQELT